MDKKLREFNEHFCNKLRNCNFLKLLRMSKQKKITKKKMVNR